MDIHYKIIEVNPNEHAIIVRYFTDFLSEEHLATNPEDPNRLPDGSPVRCRTDYNINIPIPAPEGDVLHEYILSKAPTHWFDILHKVGDPMVDTSMSAMINMLGVVQTKSVDYSAVAAFIPQQLPEPVIPDGEAGKMTDDDIQALLKKAAAGQAAG